MAIFAGGKALLGIDPGYHVINWLLLYNYTVGILTVSITAILIWKNHRYMLPASIGTFSVHAVVMIILQTLFRDVVAPDSIQAMTIRLIVWTIILGLIFAQKRLDRKPRTSKQPVAAPGV
jgi:predicted membrane protein